MWIVCIQDLNLYSNMRVLRNVGYEELVQSFRWIVWTIYGAATAATEMSQHLSCNSPVYNGSSLNCNLFNCHIVIEVENVTLSTLLLYPLTSSTCSCNYHILNIIRILEIKYYTLVKCILDNSIFICENNNICSSFFRNILNIYQSTTSWNWEATLFTET